MRKKVEERGFVQALRKQGLSFREIKAQIPVSKSSISLWCRSVELDQAQQEVLRQRKLDAAQKGLLEIARLRQAGQLVRSRTRADKRTRHVEPPVHAEEIERIKALYNGERLSFREVAVRMGIGQWHVYKLMQKYGIPRRRGSEQNHATYKNKPQFCLRSGLTSEEEKLRVAGTMLYLAEGAKKGSSVDFTNSDPRLIALFLAFLRQVCGVAEERLRVHLYAYADQDVEQLTAFWSDVTRIPSHQFIRPYVRPLTPNISRRKMSHGLVHITYSDVRLLQLIQRWGEEIYQSWAGAGAVNRISL